MAYNSFGTLWTAASGTGNPGSTVARHAAITSFTNTAPTWVWQNIAPAGSGNPSIWPRALRLMLGGTAPTATLTMELAIVTDVVTPVIANPGLVAANVNTDTRDVTTKSVSQITGYLAASTLSVTAPSSAYRTVCRSRLLTGLGITGDSYVFQFGMQDQRMDNGHAGASVRATDPTHLAMQCAGWSLAPGQVAYIYMWWLTEATNASTWEWAFEWYEL